MRVIIICMLIIWVMTFDYCLIYGPQHFRVTYCLYLIILFYRQYVPPHIGPNLPDAEPLSV